MRQGNGWKLIGGSVYERKDGLRLHLLGLVRMIDGTTFSGNVHPEYIAMHKSIRVNGGNRKRGLMAWANDVFERINNGKL